MHGSTHKMGLEMPHVRPMLAAMGARSYSGVERGLRSPCIGNVAGLAKPVGMSTAEFCQGVDQ
jgi:hypothetical protein